METASFTIYDKTTKFVTQIQCLSVLGKGGKFSNALDGIRLYLLFVGTTHLV